MKLVIITAIQEFEAAIKKQLKAAEVTTFSFKNVSGYRDSTEDALETNWFSSEMNITQSILFYAFVKKENVGKLFKSIAEFNAQQETLSKIHLAVVNVEQSNLN
jgi:nitrogen regulatory protein PII